MEQPCSRCGYISDRPARFCRQCGAALFAETDATSATTRNYAPNQPPQMTPNQSPTPQSGASSGLDEHAPDTTRFYRPPIAPTTPYYGAPAPVKSNAGMWVLIALLAFLLVGGGIAGYLFSTFRTQTQSTIEGDLERTISAQIEKQMQEQMKAAEEQAKIAEEMRKKAEQSGEIPPPPPLPPSPGNELAAGLEKYKYPNAEVQQQVNVIGNEFAKMTTDDGVEKVAAHYNQLIGKPLTKGKQEDGAKYIFQERGAPSTIVIVSPDEENAGKTQIVVVRSGFQMPKLN
jgi:hypothetical protein